MKALILTTSVIALAVTAPISGAQTTSSSASSASASSSAAPSSISAATAYYTTDESPLGDLLDNPATKAVLEKHIPKVINNDQIDQARGMTLKAIQPYASEILTDQALADIDADLKKIPAPK